MEAVISEEGGQLQAAFSDGTTRRYVDVDALIEDLYTLRILPENVRITDWHADLDRSPNSGTKIALKYGLLKKYMMP